MVLQVAHLTYLTQHRTKSPRQEIYPTKTPSTSVLSSARTTKSTRTATKTITPTSTTWLTRHGPRNEPLHMKTFLIENEMKFNVNIEIVLYVVLKWLKNLM